MVRTSGTKSKMYKTHKVKSHFSPWCVQVTARSLPQKLPWASFQRCLTNTFKFFLFAHEAHCSTSCFFSHNRRADISLLVCTELL